MFRRIFILFTDKELRNKLLLVLILAIACRLVLYVPLPFVNIKDFIELSNQRSGDAISSFLNTVLGAGYGSVSVGMLGIGPYITASIVIQLLAVIVPSLTKLQEEGGSAAQMKMNHYTRLLALLLAFINGFVIILNIVTGSLNSSSGTATKNPFASIPELKNFTFNPTSVMYISFLALCLAAGTLFLMWVSEIISETKIANGASLLILVSSLSSIPLYFGETWAGFLANMNVVRDNLQKLEFNNSFLQNAWNLFLDIFFRGDNYIVFREFLLVVFVSIFSLSVIFVNEAIKKITILYARRGHSEGASRMTGSVTSSLPVRITGAGLMGIIIAVAFIATPVILNNLTAFSNIDALKNVTADARCFISQDQLLQQRNRFNTTDELTARCYGAQIQDVQEGSGNAGLSKLQEQQAILKGQAPKNNYLGLYFSQNADELNAAKKINETDGQELFGFNISTLKNSTFKNEFDTGLRWYDTKFKTPEFNLNPGFLPEFGIRFNGILAYYLLFFLLVIFFNYFFTLVVQNSTDKIGKDLQKMGAYIPGVNPGKPTETFLESKISRVILPGALFTAFIAISPYLIPAIFKANSTVFNVIQGTVLFIIVSTALEIVRNLDAETTIVDYERYSKF
jgi:preprotein translocase subunit SecY